MSNGVYQCGDCGELGDDEHSCKCSFIGYGVDQRLADAEARVRALEGYEQTHIENLEALRARVAELESLGAPPDDSEQSHYNTCRRAREWWHANTGLTGEAATGRFLLGWVLETVYAQNVRHKAEVEALRAKVEGR
jgi:hypothetical protein